MTREAIIDRGYLFSLNIEQKDTLLKGELGLLDSDLAFVRQPADMGERVYRGGKILADRGYGNQITSHTLAALIYDRWENPMNLVGSVGRKLSLMFREKRDGRVNETGLNVTNIQLLRENVGGYNGNLYEAKAAWPNFQAGQTDWLRSVRIPLQIGFEEAVLLGIEWGDGSLNVSEDGYTLSLTGNQRDFDFYDIVGREINRIHNIEAPVREDRREIRGGRKTYYSAYPEITVSSKALGTWLIDDLGFSYQKRDVGMPRISFTTEQRTGFFIGILASMGRTAPKSGVYLSDGDIMFVQNLMQLGKDLGFDPSFHEFVRNTDGHISYNYGLYFSVKEVRLMYERGWLLNPRHLKQEKTA